MLCYIKFICDLTASPKVSRSIKSHDLYRWLNKTEKETIQECLLCSRNSLAQKNTIEAVLTFKENLRIYGYGCTMHLNDMYYIISGKTLFENSEYLGYKNEKLKFAWERSTVKCVFQRKSIDVSDCTSILSAALHLYSVKNKLTYFSVQSPLKQIPKFVYENSFHGNIIENATKELLNQADDKLSLFTKYIPLAILNYLQLRKAISVAAGEHLSNLQTENLEDLGDDTCQICTVMKFNEYSMKCSQCKMFICAYCRILAEKCPYCRSHYNKT